jgi:hypothetical protein
MHMQIMNPYNEHYNKMNYLIKKKSIFNYHIKSLFVVFLLQINECESLLISLKGANSDSLCLLEKKKIELNMLQSQIQSLKYEQSVIISKVGGNHFFYSINSFLFSRIKSKK